jgi:hypothetical protein
MESIRELIYRHLDEHGFNIVLNTSRGIAFDIEEQTVKTGHFSSREFPNKFGIDDEEYEIYILDYIFDTTGFRIDTLDNRL